MTSSVAIVQRIVPHYRVPFFRKLRGLLEQDGIDLKLFYGQELPGTVPRSAELAAEWVVRLSNRYLHIRDTELVWQPCLSQLHAFDCVIVEQANRLLINHVLQLRRMFGVQKLAFWGHGRNMQARARHGLRERFKKWRARDVDWWFAYTETTREQLKEYGFPAERITTVDNTIDASELQHALAACSGDAVTRVRHEMGLGDGPVAVYCGGLYKDKRVDFLLDACERIRATLPGFHALIIGEGPESDKVAAAAAAPWLHYLGPIYGDARARYLKVADILLMPGAVGLVVIDSFVAETPLATTDIGSHGPEFAYLRPGENCVISGDSVTAYADTVTRALTDGSLSSLRQGCRDSASRYTLENMAANFADGIVRCLGR